MGYKTSRILTTVFALWLLLWLVLSWPAVQDDAFIHLRYAANLLEHHIISYDGVHEDYGTSSLLYVVLLAALRALTTSPLLPRAVSTFFHVVLYLGLAFALARTLRNAPKPAWGFALLLLATLASPMAVRWLDDGMETSLTLCMVSLLAFALAAMAERERLTRGAAAGLFLLGLIATLTRVEYLLLLGVASLTLYFARREAGVRRLELAVAAPLAGSLLAGGTIVLTMHALTPDTAVAKADGLHAWLGTLGAMQSVLVSSLSFGILLLLLWIVTAIAAVSVQQLRLSLLAANCLFPVTLLLAVLRGQQVQGIRYFAWTLLFPILWNILVLRKAVPQERSARWLQVSVYALAVVLVCLLPVESTLLYKQFRVREAALAEFRAQHLERLQGMPLTAFDVGYIGYFTNAPLCDMAGLVNGRVRAATPFAKRVDECIAQRPQMAFVSQFSFNELQDRGYARDWSICSTYDFANLRGPDLHYLIASPAVAAEVCAAAEREAEPITRLLH